MFAAIGAALLAAGEATAATAATATAAAGTTAAAGAAGVAGAGAAGAAAAAGAEAAAGASQAASSGIGTEFMKGVIGKNSVLKYAADGSIDWGGTSARFGGRLGRNLVTQAISGDERASKGRKLLGAAVGNLMEG